MAICMGWFGCEIGNRNEKRDPFTETHRLALFGVAYIIYNSKYTGNLEKCNKFGRLISKFEEKI